MKEELERIHSELASAAGSINLMLTRRSFSKREAEETIQKLQSGVDRLQRLIADARGD